MFKAKTLFFLFFSCFLKSNLPFEIIDRVTDYTETLGDSKKLELEEKLEEFEHENQGAQIAILLIPSLRGESLEKFATQVFNQKGLGDKKLNNGVLILVVKNERKIRIEVGTGLEKILTNNYCSKIIKRTIAPKFKLGQFYNGLNNAAKDIFSKIKNPEKHQPDEHQEGYFILFLFILSVMFIFMLAKTSPFLGFIIFNIIFMLILGYLSYRFYLEQDYFFCSFMFLIFAFFFIIPFFLSAALKKIVFITSDAPIAKNIYTMKNLLIIPVVVVFLVAEDHQAVEALREVGKEFF